MSNPDDRVSRSQRRAWLFVTGALTETFLLYPIVAWIVTRGDAEPGRVVPVSALSLGIPAALCAISLVLARRSVSESSVSGFQRMSLLSLAPLELCALFGLVVSIRERRLAPALAGTVLAVMASLVFVIPAGLAFWRARAHAEGIARREPDTIDPS